MLCHEVDHLHCHAIGRNENSNNSRKCVLPHCELGRTDENVRSQRYCKCDKILWSNSAFFFNLESSDFTLYQGRNNSVQLVEHLSPSHQTPPPSSSYISGQLTELLSPAHGILQSSSRNTSIQFGELFSPACGKPQSNSSSTSVQLIKHLSPDNQTPQSSS